MEIIQRSELIPVTVWRIKSRHYLCKWQLAQCSQGYTEIQAVTWDISCLLIWPSENNVVNGVLRLLLETLRVCICVCLMRF